MTKKNTNLFPTSVHH